MLYCIGQRIRVKTKGTGTVRYVGGIQTKEGSWLGVEWDDPTQGKHSGTFGNMKYFEVKVENSGSFINAKSKIISGIGILQAAKNKYILENAEFSETVELPETIGKYGKIEAVGFGKILKNNSNLQNLSIISFDDGIISGIMDDNVQDIEQNLCNVTSLDLSNNLISSWQELKRTASCFPKLASLWLNKNKMDFSLVNSSNLSFAKNQTLSSISSLNLSYTNITWDQALLICENDLPSLRELHLGFNSIKHITGSKPHLETVFKNLILLDLQHNDINNFQDLTCLDTLPSLAELNVSGNELLGFPVNIDSNEHGRCWKSLQKLEINDSRIDSWSVMSSLNSLPQLFELGIRNSSLNINSKDITFESYVVGLIGNLKRLNGSYITASERKDFEISYFNYIKSSMNLPENEVDPDFARLANPRFEMIAKKFNYNISRDLDSKGNPAPIVISKFMKLELYLAEQNSENPSSDIKLDPLLGSKKIKQFSSTTLTRSFRSVVSKIFSLRPTAIEMYRVVTILNGTSYYITLDKPTRPLQHYGVENGDKIFVVNSK